MSPSHRRRPSRAACLSTWALALCAAAAFASTAAALPTNASLALASEANATTASAVSGPSARVRLNGTAVEVEAADLLGGGLVVELAAAKNVTTSAARTGALAEVSLSLNVSLPTGRVLAVETSTTARENRSSVVDEASTTGNSTTVLSTATRTDTTRSTLSASRNSTRTASRISTVRTRTATSDVLSSANPRTTTATRSRSTVVASTRSAERVIASSAAASAVASASRSRTTASAKPSPTRYGAAPTKGCKKPPVTFAGTDAGFATLCSVRYCDALPRRNMVWSGNAGNVTRQEIETALGMLRELEPLWENGHGNVLSDGWLGQGMHDAGLLYEITGDRRALDVIVNVADNILALQNANTPGGGVTIWTGAKDSVWPTGDLYPEDGKLVYAGCEQGLIAGNMVAAAVFILKSPCLWDMVPPVFDGPTIFGKKTTYYERALAYIAAADHTYQSFFWRFLDSNLNLINPADERWWQTGDTRAPGTPMPWNRGMMMMHGYLRLAAAHETEAAFNANTTAYYDTIAKQHIGNFVRDLNEIKALRNGVTTFDWDYSHGEDHAEESQGVHAYFDIWGSWIGWQRNSAVFGLSNFIGRTFADTFENTIAFGNGSFSGLVTGSSTTKAYTINRLYGGWSFYALWLPEWYETVATANVEAGFSGRTWLAIPLLWTKHALALNDITFWSSRFSSGFGVIVGTEEGAGSTTSSRSGSFSGAPSAQVAHTTLLSTLVGAVVVLIGAA
ncbi:hypothetical protein JCM10449v2_003562 [Rhodotorula kratochvilovae]